MIGKDKCVQCNPQSVTDIVKEKRDLAKHTKATKEEYLLYFNEHQKMAVKDPERHCLIERIFHLFLLR